MFSKKRQFIVTISLILVIGILLLMGVFLVSKKIFDQKFSYKSTKPIDLPSNINKEVNETNAEDVVPEPAEVYDIGGLVKDINNNEITIEENTLMLDKNPELDKRLIIVDSSTKIWLLINKTPTELAIEMNNFQEKLNNWRASKEEERGEIPKKPIPLKEKKEGILGDIKIGQNIMIITNQNIKEEKEFTANEILIKDFQE